jgi:hypothetical protein
MTHGYEFFEYDYFDLDLLDLVGFGDVESNLPDSVEDVSDEWGAIDYDEIIGWF